MGKYKKHQRIDTDPSNPNMMPLGPRGGGDLLEDLEAGADDNDDLGTLKVNKAYAARFEHRKKMEEFNQLKDKYGETAIFGSKSKQSSNDDEEDDSTDESDEEEDETGELVTAELDAKILKTIGLIRAKNPAVYDPEKKFFTDEDIEAARKRWEEKQKSLQESGEKMTLKDYHRKNLLEGAKEDDDDDDSDGGFKVAKKKEEKGSKTYVEEQEELKDELKKALWDNDDDDDDDELLTVRKKGKEELEEEERDFKQFLMENFASEGAEGLQDWKRYAEGDESVAENQDEKFLMDFILNKGWVDKNANRVPTYEEVVKTEMIDEEEEEEVDRFEKAYNFRFEEEDGTNIQTYAREVEGSMRRKDRRRAEARAALKARKVEEAARKAEELKRLKNLKKEEIARRLQKIAEVAGADVQMFQDVDLTEDFDPSKFDEMMTKKFSDDYYADDDNIKPVFDDGLEDMEEDADFDVEGLVDQAVAPKSGKGKVQLKPRQEDYVEEEGEQGGEEGQEDWGEGYAGEGDEDADNFIMDADYLPGGENFSEELVSAKSKKKDKKDKKKKKGKEKLSLDQYLDEVYQLDYEDMIGDMPTRFKYRKVEPDTYGLKPDEILVAPDAALNDLMPLKRIAPFRPPEKLERDRQIFKKTKKKKIKAVREAIQAVIQGTTVEEMQAEKKKKGQAAKKKEKKLKRKAQEEQEPNKKAKVAVEEEEPLIPLVIEPTPENLGAEQGGSELASKEGGVEKPGSSKEKKRHKSNNDQGKFKTHDNKANGRHYNNKYNDKSDKHKGGVSNDRLASYQMPSTKKKDRA
ncbi:KRRI-Interacting protein 1 [Chytridiales sp. JEL 0842]|nr:KRRI-Interacting protein 1 [Chytridiales sp. JEL 0842]